MKDERKEVYNSLFDSVEKNLKGLEAEVFSASDSRHYFASIRTLLDLAKAALLNSVEESKIKTEICLVRAELIEVLQEQNNSKSEVIKRLLCEKNDLLAKLGK